MRDEQRIAEIRARVEAATARPWTSDAANARYHADFIAHARSDIPWLLAEIERLTLEQSPDSRRGNV